MRLVIVLIVLSALCTTAYAEPVVSGSGDSGRFQSVSGDFAKKWISDFKEQNEKPKEDLKNELWNWGGAPKGKKMVNGKLIDDTDNLTSKVNFTANWLGDLSVGKPVYLNGTNPYGNYGTTGGKFNAAPLTPLALSDDPWILAQQLERPVSFKRSDYYTSDVKL